MVFRRCTRAKTPISARYTLVFSIIAQMFLNCKHLFGFFKKFFYFSFFRNYMTNFFMYVHSLFIFNLYSVLVLDRMGAATRPTECFYTPSSSNPSIRESPGTATGAFSYARKFRREKAAFSTNCKSLHFQNRNARLSLTGFFNKTAKTQSDSDFSQKNRTY